MRVFGALVIGVGAALLAGRAAADPIPIPPVPVPTPTVPTVTVPSLPAPAPTLPAPTPTPTPTAPAPSPAAPEVPKAEVAAPVPTAPPSAPAVAQVAGGSSGTTRSQPSAPPVKTIGGKRHRTTTFTFVLHRAGRVVLTVSQVAPVCVGIGHLTVAGHAGANRFRFAGVLHGRRLTPGTYRITIRTAAGEVLRRLTLVMGEGSAPANVCHGATSTATVSAGAAGPFAPQRLPVTRPAAAGLAPAHGPKLTSGVLGSSVAKTARAIQPFLVGALALAILLLGIASLPREAVPGARMHYALARHRAEVAGLGAGVLIAVGVAFLLNL
jgi:hypothetical protein